MGRFVKAELLLSLFAILSLMAFSACDSSSDDDSDNLPSGDADMELAIDGDDVDAEAVEQDLELEPESESDLDGDVDDIEQDTSEPEEETDPEEEQEADAVDGDLDMDQVESIEGVEADEEVLETEPELEIEPELEPELELEAEPELEPEVEAVVWHEAPAPQGVLVVNSDGVSSSLSTIAFADQALDEAFVGSASELSPDTLAALSSMELAVPSYPLTGNLRGVLDVPNDRYIWFPPVAKAVLAQQINIDYGFGISDLLQLNDGRYYVLRLDSNPAENPAVDFDEGGDVLILDDTGAATGRIDLAAYADTVDDVVLEPHPERMAYAWGLVWVTLGNYDLNQNVWSDGKLVAIDPSDDSVVYQYTISGQHNCEGIAYMSYTDKLALVCQGAPNDDNPKSHSGIFGYAWDGSALTEAFSKQAAYMGFYPLSGKIAVYKQHVFVIESAPVMMQPGDALWSMNTLNSATAYIFGSLYGQGLGGLAVDEAGQILYVSDKYIPAVRLVDLSGSSFVELTEDSIETDSVNSLPPVNLGLY